jgi:hypothetical protein
MQKHLFLFFTITLFFLLFSSCSAVRQGVAFLRAPAGFIDSGNNVRIENESDEQFGKNICQSLPELIDSVEIKLHHRFMNPPVIYLCNSYRSFCKYTGSKYPGPRAHANKAVFISPRLRGSKDWREIIYHELTHVLLFQNLGAYRYGTIPVWFHEGLATYVSYGGGSGDVTDSAAILEITKGNHFNPVEHEFILFPKSFENDKISAWMKYRQAMLFVACMKKGREKDFEGVLNALFKKKSFSRSVEAAYGVRISELWKEFLFQTRSIPNPS